MTENSEQPKAATNPTVTFIWDWNCKNLIPRKAENNTNFVK